MTKPKASACVVRAESECSQSSGNDEVIADIVQCLVGNPAAVVAWVGDLVIKRFNFKSKTFRVCINGKERSCGAGELLEDRVDDALRFLYDKHFWDGPV